MRLARLQGGILGILFFPITAAVSLFLISKYPPQRLAFTAWVIVYSGLIALPLGFIIRIVLVRWFRRMD